MASASAKVSTSIITPEQKVMFAPAIGAGTPKQNHVLIFGTKVTSVGYALLVPKKKIAEEWDAMRG